MSTRTLLLAFVLALLPALAVTVPLRALLPAPTLAAAGIETSAVAGTAWRGELRDVRWRGHALGDVAVRAAVLPLLWGERRAALSGTGWRATVVSGRRDGVLSLSARVPLALGALALPTGAQLHAEEMSVVFEGEGCMRAEGVVALALPALGGGAAPRLHGRWRCAGREAALDLEPQGPGLPLRLTLRLSADGVYRMEAIAAAALDPAARAMLRAAGFQPGPGGLSRSITGRLRPADAASGN